MDETVKISIDIPKSMHDKLLAASYNSKIKGEKKSMSEIIRDGIENELKKH